MDTYSKEIVYNSLHMNSQYPYHMFYDMPVGNPIFTTETNLDNIIGFVFGTITHPSIELLRVLLIHRRVGKKNRNAQNTF